VALGDLSGHDWPAISLVDELVNGLAFGGGIIVIKLENNQIGHTAIHTWMRQQMLPHLLLECKSVCTRTAIVAHNISGSIDSIVRLAIRGDTGLAPPMSPADGFVSVSELFSLFRFAALGTGLHEWSSPQ
jgi:hypothetical protein